MRRNGRYGSMDFFEKSRKVIKYELIVCLRKKNGAPGANQDSVCLLWGERERRYELLSMIEQSDIIRATSLPNATPITYAQRNERHTME